MEKWNELSVLVDLGFSQRSIAVKIGVGQTAVRYALKKYGIKTRAAPKGKSGSPKRTHCVVCLREMVNNPRNLSKCGTCVTAIRRFLTKQKAIQMLGGKCARCGYDKHPAALEFHHKDGGITKEFSIGMVANKSWESIVEELKKCDLLCSNCHKIEHSKRTSGYLEVAVKNYRGKFIGLLAETV